MQLQFISVFSDFDNNILGNVSAVILLENNISDEEMQKIASDLNQPATTFLKSIDQENYSVRWFAPDAEIGLCGHGSLAATAFLCEKNHLQKIKLYKDENEIIGIKNSDGTYQMSLDAIEVNERIEVPQEVKDGFGVEILELWKSDNKYIALVNDEKTLQNIQPKFDTLRKSEIFGYAVTAKGDKCDFVSRTFVPHVQQLEDHATGSSHAVLVPFWANKLKNNKLKALQLSRRGGSFQCELKNNLVNLKGEVRFLTGITSLQVD